MLEGDLNYSRANIGDAEALVPLINRAFAMELEFFSTERIDLAGVLDYMQKGEILTVENARHIVGCIYVELRGEKCYFGLLSVEPESQGRGLGRKLIDAAEDYARSHGCTVMEIRVLDLRTELPPLYEKLGYAFAYDEHVEPIPSALQPYHFIIMEKQLVSG